MFSSAIASTLVAGAAVVYAVRSHWTMRNMVFPVFKARVCVQCGLRRDMLAFASTKSKRCTACTQLLPAPKPVPGRVRMWKSQTARVRTELKKAGIKLPNAKALLGVANADELWQHLEPKLSPGMTEANYGQWHVDHASPVAAYDLKQESHRARCFNVHNMTPMWAQDNLGKSSAMQ